MIACSFLFTSPRLKQVYHKKKKSQEKSPDFSGLISYFFFRLASVALAALIRPAAILRSDRLLPPLAPSERI